MSKMTAGAGRWIPLLLSIVFWASCKLVKEDRRYCPCTLSVVLRDLPAYPLALYVNGAWAGEADADTTLAVWVEKGPRADVVALSGARLLEDGCVHILYGLQAPPLYAFSGVADCSGETGSVTVQLQRHFCTLSLAFEGPPGWGEPYRVQVRGVVGGFRPLDGQPLEGPFLCTLDADYCCRLPRQFASARLWLDIVLPDRILRSFPLDEYLRLAGYDWTAPDLADIPLQINLSITEIRFHMGAWSTVVPLEITI